MDNNKVKEGGYCVRCDTVWAPPGKCRCFENNVEAKEMTNKEMVFKMLEGRIETMQTLAVESIELIYNAGYNEAIDDATRIVDSYDMPQGFAEIRKLKK